MLRQEKTTYHSPQLSQPLADYLCKCLLDLVAHYVTDTWQIALPMMKEGSKWMLYIPPNLAYGERGAGRAIGPNETLVFEIELLKVK